MSTEPPPWPAGVGLHRCGVIDSTNAEAARIASAGAPGPVWIIAEAQSAGRGRRGRGWQSPPGNFAATLLMRPEGPPAAAALMGFVAATALRAALAGAGVAGLALKWPNDVLLGGRKLSGILLESAGSGAAVHHLAIGIGVNLVAAPPPEALEPGATPATSLLEATGIVLKPEALLARLAPEIAARTEALGRAGFAPIRAEWLAHAAGIGAPIRARTARTTHEGRFETIDATGALILATESGPLALSAAEVFPLAE
ncbi:MAG: biotin--[acetyl-CoA-carboxylase] ligase [Gemmobacter sp.]